SRSGSSPSCWSPDAGSATSSPRPLGSSSAIGVFSNGPCGKQRSLRLWSSVPRVRGPDGTGTGDDPRRGRVALGRHLLWSEALGGGLVDDPAAPRQQRSGEDLVVEVGRQLPLLVEEDLQQGEDVAGVEQARVVGHGGRQVRGPQDQHAVLHHLAVRLRKLAV